MGEMAAAAVVGGTAKSTEFTVALHQSRVSVLAGVVVQRLKTE